MKNLDTLVLENPIGAMQLDRESMIKLLERIAKEHWDAVYVRLSYEHNITSCDQLCHSFPVILQLQDQALDQKTSAAGELTRLLCSLNKYGVTRLDLAYTSEYKNFKEACYYSHVKKIVNSFPIPGINPRLSNSGRNFMIIGNSVVVYNVHYRGEKLWGEVSNIEATYRFWKDCFYEAITPQ